MHIPNYLEDSVTDVLIQIDFFTLYNMTEKKTSKHRSSFRSSKYVFPKMYLI